MPVDQNGVLIDNALPEPGNFYPVEWPGFQSQTREFAAPDGQTRVENLNFVMIPAVAGDEAVELIATVRLEDGVDASGVIVEARVGGSLLEPPSARPPEGRPILGPVEHTLRLWRDGYLPLDVTVLYSGDEAGAVSF